MKYNFYNQDSSIPPPPPPPPSSTTPPPPPSFSQTPGSGSTGQASTNAIIALVAGILSWVFCPFILGIVAWIMGKGELNKIDRGESSEAGRTFAKTGMWLGIINVVLSLLFGIIYVIVIVLALVVGN